MRQPVMGQKPRQRHASGGSWAGAAISPRPCGPRRPSADCARGAGGPRGTLAAAAAAALAVSVALTGCSGLPVPPAPSGPQSTVPVPSGTPSNNPSGIPSSTPSGSDAGTATGSPEASGGAGGFGSIAEACAAVSATVLSVLVLPMAAAGGQNTAELEKARTELEKLQARVPVEIKDPIIKLKAISEAASRDLSSFNSEEFDKAIAPIDAWLQSHC